MEKAVAGPESIPIRFIGLDVHKQYAVAAGVDEHQHIVLSSRRVALERSAHLGAQGTSTDGSTACTYNPVGNRLTMDSTSYSYDKADRITVAGSTSYTVNLGPFLASATTRRGLNGPVILLIRNSQ